MSEAETPEPNSEQSHKSGREVRWDPWFSEENMSHRRRKITYDKEQYDSWLGDTSHLPTHYNNGHAALLQKAKRATQRDFKGNSRNAVTDFTSWIFELEHKPSVAAKTSGIIGESMVQKWKRILARGKMYDTGWTLIFWDNPEEENRQGLKISAQKVNGTPMFGRPDYVLFNAVLETALIVEVKHSLATPPIDGWPNLRAQLWAYGQLDFIVERKPKNVILIGEVWNVHMNDGFLGIDLRKTYRWDMSDIQFCRENEELFACYQQHASR